MPPMPMQSLRDLFTYGIMDAYDMETRLLDAMDRMSREATDLRVRGLLDGHRQQTVKQVERLRKVFDVLHLEPTGGEGCRPIMGLIAERDVFKQANPSPAVLQTFDVAASAKTEAFEVACYEGLVSLAQKLELQDVVALLGESLSEEREQLRRVTQMSQENFASVAGKAGVEQGSRAPGRS